MKTLIRNGRVSILFFFNPYPRAFAGPAMSLLVCKEFPASLCNRILFLGKQQQCGPPQPENPAVSLIQNKELGLGHLDWLVIEVMPNLELMVPLETLRHMLRWNVKFPPSQRTEA